MTDINAEVDTKPAPAPKSAKSKAIKKMSKFVKDPEAERQFDDLRRKYGNAVAYLLLMNVKYSELRDYFYLNEDNYRRYQSLKKFRYAILDARPKARQWIDKPFYIGLKLGSLVTNDEETPAVSLVLGECVFKKPTSVISSRWELEAYMDTIQKIIENERIWSDPEMADFDIGARDDYSIKYLKKKAAAAVYPIESTDAPIVIE